MPCARPMSLLLRAGELEPHVREALEIRAELSKSSTKKYYALAGATGSDGRLRGCFQFNGAARTGRWAGRLFQPQNLPRGTIKPDYIGTARAAVKMGDYDLLATLYGSVSDVLVSCVRTAIAAPAGQSTRRRRLRQHRDSDDRLGRGVPDAA